MKYFIANILSTIIFFAGCSNTHHTSYTIKHKVTACQSYAIGTEGTTKNDDMIVRDDTIPRYLLVGNFTGKMVDTLVCTPTGEMEEDGHYYSWYIKGMNNTVPPFEIQHTVMGQLYHEGDLNGDGTDEFGILHSTGTSAINSYRVYTYADSKWCYLYDTQYGSSWLGHWGWSEGEPLDNMASPIKGKNSVHVRYSDFRNDKWTVVDSIVETQFIAINTD